MRHFFPFVFIFMLMLNATNGYDPYPYNPVIHTLGNHGLLGRVHAEIGPLFTRFTDKIVYERNVRQDVINMIGNKRTLDIGCGTGFSTSEFPGSIGIDTSIPMIEKAQKVFPHKSFEIGHAEHWNFCHPIDVVTLMFCFHEIPQYNRLNIIAVSYTHLTLPTKA